MEPTKFLCVAGVGYKVDLTSDKGGRKLRN